MPDCLSSSGVKDEWVIKLILKEQNFPTLQTSSFSQFINLQHLDLSSSNVAIIEDFWLANIDSLVVLHLYNNYLTKLQTGMFDHMTKLRYLTLSNNEDLAEYTTNAWHFCQSLEKGDLNLQFDKNIFKDLKVDVNTESYCASHENGDDPVASSCTNNDGHLTCSGDIADLVCELRDMDFKSIVFSFPKDDWSLNT